MLKFESLETLVKSLAWYFHRYRLRQNWTICVYDNNNTEFCETVEIVSRWNVSGKKFTSASGLYFTNFRSYLGWSKCLPTPFQKLKWRHCSNAEPVLVNMILRTAKKKSEENDVYIKQILVLIVRRLATKLPCASKRMRIWITSHWCSSHCIQECTDRSVYARFQWRYKLN